MAPWFRRLILAFAVGSFIALLTGLWTIGLLGFTALLGLLALYTFFHDE